MRRGIYKKFTVTRSDGSSDPGGRHHDCAYFVLDLECDEFAIPALKAYVNAAKGTNPSLARDLTAIIAARTAKESTDCHCREVGCIHSLGQALTPRTSDVAFGLMKPVRCLGTTCFAPSNVQCLACGMYGQRCDRVKAP